MTEHNCRQINSGCYRCELGRDEEVAAIAEDHWETNIAPGLAKSGIPSRTLDSMLVRYIQDVLKDEQAIKELYEWAALNRD